MKEDCLCRKMEDADLARMAQEGDLEAEETLMRRYKDIVRIKSQYYYMAGADGDDVVQEGMIGLLRAVRKYDPDRDASFSTFAGICVTRQIIDAIRTADREKNRPLNTSVSLSRPVDPENGDMTLSDILEGKTAESPESFLVIRDMASYIMNNGDNIFSDLEMQVLGEMVKGSSLEEISGKLDKNYKSIDNAVQRIKKKINDHLWR